MHGKIKYHLVHGIPSTIWWLYGRIPLYWPTATKWYVQVSQHVIIKSRIWCEKKLSGNGLFVCKTGLVDLKY